MLKDHRLTLMAEALHLDGAEIIDCNPTDPNKEYRIHGRGHVVEEGFISVCGLFAYAVVKYVVPTPSRATTIESLDIKPRP